MSLHEYALYVVREQARGDLHADAIKAEVVAVGGAPASGDDLEGTAAFGRVPCIVRRSRNDADPSSPLEILTVALDERALEAMLREAPGEFVRWLWLVAESTNPAAFFMTSGGDMHYFEQGKPIHAVTFAQLPRLVARGEIAVVHPLMYFAERLGDGALCAKARNAPWPLIENRAGLGCLLLLVNRDAASGAIDIIEPGTMYAGLRAFFDRP